MASGNSEQGDATPTSALVGRTSRWLVSYPRAVPLAIFLLIAAVTAISVISIERGDDQREQEQIDQIARTVGATMQRRASTSTAYLRAGGALFSTVEAVPIDLFRRFARELRIDDQFRVSGGIGWAQVISPEGVAEFERATARQLGRQVDVYRMPRAPKFPSLVPVTFSLPDSERVQRAIGFDMYSEPIRRAAMEQAVRTQEPTTSGPVMLVSGSDGPRPGFLIFMPVYTTRGTDRQLSGFVYSPFDGQEFLESAIYEGLAGDRAIRLYADERKPSNLLGSFQARNETGKARIIEIMIGDRQMLVEVQAENNGMLSAISMITLLFGLAVASLSMLVARLLTQQAMEDMAALEYFSEQNSIRNSLTRELNHRVKNTLANVLSIIALTRRRAASLDEFANSLDGRIRALSATHDLLTQSEWGSTPLRKVVEAELAPYADASDRVVRLEGPDVELAPNDALSFGLAIHELATNASKYGALSVDTGNVTVRWNKESADVVRVEWTERGGPAVPEQRSRGFGTELIERIVAHELRHPVDLEFDPKGVRCILRVPLRQATEFAIRAGR